jgi:hypothetical protein
VAGSLCWKKTPGLFGIPLKPHPLRARRVPCFRGPSRHGRQTNELVRRESMLRTAGGPGASTEDYGRVVVYGPWSESHMRSRGQHAFAAPAHLAEGSGSPKGRESMAHGAGRLRFTLSGTDS